MLSAKKTLVALFFMASAVITVSCNKDNEQDKPGSGSFVSAKVDINYKFTVESLSATTMQRAYDVVVEYYDAAGQKNSISPVNPDNLTWEMSLTQTSFPTWYGVQVSLVPKSDLSDVTETEKFNFQGKVDVNATIISTSGATKRLHSGLVEMAYNGLRPHNGRTNSKSFRCNVKSDGNSETSVEWE